MYVQTFYHRVVWGVAKHNLFKMKRVLLPFCSLCVTFLLTSCYTTTVSVGDLGPKDPVVEAHRKRNPHFIAGLVGSPKLEDQDFVGEHKDYRIKNQQTFVDGLLTAITVGIYSPTTTRFYLPYGTEIPEKKKRDPLPPIQFGVRAGLNIASMHEASEIVGGSKAGLNIGVMMDLPMSKYFYFSPEILFSQKGAKNFSYNCLELAMPFTYHRKIVTDIQIQGGLGPYVSLAPNPEEIDVWNPYGKFDMGLQFVIGGTYKKHYYLGFAYDLSLGKIKNGFEFDPSYDSPRVFSINIGYNF